MPFINDSDDPEPGMICDLIDTQRIAQDVYNELRRRVDDRLSTGKIAKAISDAINLELGKTVHQHEERLTSVERRQHKSKSALVRGLTQIIKIMSGDE